MWSPTTISRQETKYTKTKTKTKTKFAIRFLQCTSSCVIQNFFLPANLPVYLHPCASTNEFNRLLRALPFPYVSSFHDQTSHSEIGFVYQHWLKGLLFYAKLIEQNVEVVVKFCSWYNQDVHSYSHSLGFATALFSIQNFGNYIMVVMEKLPSFSRTDCTREDATNGSISCGQIQYILDKLKKCYVHGDMRETNILIDTLGHRDILVDFDWARIDGVDVYAPFMNRRISL